MQHIKAKEEGTSIIKGEFFISLSKEDRDKLLLKLVAIKGVNLYTIKDKSGV